MLDIFIILLLLLLFAPAILFVIGVLMSLFVDKINDTKDRELRQKIREAEERLSRVQGYREGAIKMILDLGLKPSSCKDVLRKRDRDIRLADDALRAARNSLIDYHGQKERDCPSRKYRYTVKDLFLK